MLGIEAPSALELASAFVLWLKVITNSFPFDISISLLSIVDITYSNKYGVDPLFSFEQFVRVIVKYSSQVIGPRDIMSLLSFISRSSSIIVMVYYLFLIVFMVKSCYSDIESL
jgi:hypothetical protein